jgi:hypothetical protein
MVLKRERDYTFARGDRTADSPSVNDVPEGHSARGWSVALGPTGFARSGPHSLGCWRRGHARWWGRGRSSRLGRRDLQHSCVRGVRHARWPERQGRGNHCCAHATQQGRSVQDRGCDRTRGRRGHPRRPDGTAADSLNSTAGSTLSLQRPLAPMERRALARLPVTACNPTRDTGPINRPNATTPLHDGSQRPRHAQARAEQQQTPPAGLAQFRRSEV